MVKAQDMVELWRGGLLESTHRGHAVVCDEKGQIVAAWGDPGRVIFPRSSAKMMQALPLVESGAADAFGLTPRQLSLACASHEGSAMHVGAARDWLAGLGLGDSDLRCGAHEPSNRAERDRLIQTGDRPCQLHNNCSGKHSGFLTTTKHLRAGPEYIEIDHPLQKAIRAAIEEVTDEVVAGWGIDGCSAPNFANTVGALARAMARYAVAREDAPGTRERAMARLRGAMAAHPEMVSGEGRACTDLMRACGQGVALKGGAEAVYVAMLPAQRLGLCLKIEDGTSRAAEAALVALLTRFGALDAANPAAQAHLPAPQKNWRGFTTGELRLSPGFA